MKKHIVVTSLVLVLAFLISGCSLFDPKVPVSCGGEVERIKMENVKAYKEACDIASGKSPNNVDSTPNCDCNCDAPTITQPTVIAEQAMVVTENVTAALTCSYDYSVMPKGKDTDGIPLADYGIKYSGEIVGPAMVQLDSLTVISIFPGESYVVPEGKIVTWKYTGDEACLRSQFQWFPGKTIVRLSK